MDFQSDLGEPEHDRKKYFQKEQNLKEDVFFFFKKKFPQFFSLTEQDESQVRKHLRNDWNVMSRSSSSVNDQHTLFSVGAEKVNLLHDELLVSKVRSAALVFGNPAVLFDTHVGMQTRRQHIERNLHPESGVVLRQMRIGRKRPFHQRQTNKGPPRPGNVNKRKTMKIRFPPLFLFLFFVLKKTL